MSLFGQNTFNFDYSVSPDICFNENGIINIDANISGLYQFPLPWYIVVETEEDGDLYYDMDTESFQITGLKSGVYYVTVWIDYEEGCSEEFDVELNNPNDYDCSILFQISPEVIYIDCSEARVDLNISPNDIDYENFVIKWFDPHGNEMESEMNYPNILVTEAGMYCYEMEGHEGCCKASGCMEVIQENMDAQLKIEINASENNPLPACGMHDGFIEVIAFHNEDSVCEDCTFEWSDSEGNVVSTQSSVNGHAGVYCVKVTDTIKGCSNTKCFEIENYTIIIEVPTITHLDCDNRDYATIELDVELLSPSEGRDYVLNYEWNTGDDDPTIYPGDPGTYTVTISVNGESPRCDRILDFEILQEETGQVTGTTVEMDECLGGSIEVLTAPGTSSIVWKNLSGAIFPEFDGMWKIENLWSETFCYHVTNDCGIDTDCIVIDNGFNNIFREPSVSIFNSFDCEDETGMIRINHISGPPIDSIKWSNGMTGSIISGLNDGAYTVTIYGSNGCQLVRTYHIEAVNGFQIIAIDIEKSCPNNNSGKLYVGCDRSVIFEWTGPNGFEETVEDIITNFQNLVPGEYCVHIRDSLSTCTRDRCYIVGSYPDMGQLGFNYETVDNCQGQSKGEIILNVFGGTGIYYYSCIDHYGNYWSWGPHIKNLPTGVYHVTVTDNCGQSVSETIEVIDADLEFDEMHVWLAGREFVGINRLKVTIGVSGGSGSFEYDWYRVPISVISPSYLNHLVTSHVPFYSQVDSRRDHVVRVKDLITGCERELFIEACPVPEENLRVRIELAGTQDCSKSIDFIDYKIIIENGTPPFRISQWPAAPFDTHDRVIEMSHQVFKNKNIFNEPQYVEGFTRVDLTVTVTDYCGYKAFRDREVTCNELCPEDCIRINKSRDPSCTYLSRSSTSECCDSGKCCDDFSLRSKCDDDHLRFVKKWNTLPRNTAEFLGKTRLDTELMPIHGPDYMEAFFILNQSNGCINSRFVPVPPRCIRLDEWFTTTFGGGPTTGNSRCPKITIKSNPLANNIGFFLWVLFDNVRSDCTVDIRITNHLNGKTITISGIPVNEENQEFSQKFYNYGDFQSTIGGDYEVVVIPNCGSSLCSNKRSRFKIDEDYYNPIVNPCDKNTLNLVYNEDFDAFVHFYKEGVDSSSIYADVITNHYFEEVITKIDVEYNDKITHIDFDTNFFYFILEDTTYSNILIRVDRDDELYETKFENRKILAHHRNSKTSRMSFLVYDYISQEHQIETYTTDMTLVNIRVLDYMPKNRLLNTKFHLHSDKLFTSIERQNNQRIIKRYSNQGQDNELALPDGFEITKVFFNKYNKWIITGTAFETFNVAGVNEYFTKKTLVSIVLNEEWEILDVIYNTESEEKILSDVAYDNESNFFYTYQREYIFQETNQDTIITVTDTCSTEDYFFIDFEHEIPCPDSLTATPDDDSYSCWTISLELNEPTALSAEFDYWGLDGQNYIIIFTDTVSVELDSSNNSFYYCLEDPGQWFGQVDMRLSCLNCQDSCNLETQILYMPLIIDRDPDEHALSSVESLDLSDQLDLIPNPFSNELLLVMKEGFVHPCDIDIRLFNPQGTLALNEKIENVSVHSGTIAISGTETLAAGVYTAVIICDDKSYVKKLIKIN
jgi:hypothetical protein